MGCHRGGGQFPMTPYGSKIRRKIPTVGNLKSSSEEFTSFIRTIKLRFKLAFLTFSKTIGTMGLDCS